MTTRKSFKRAGNDLDIVYAKFATRTKTATLNLQSLRVFWHITICEMVFQLLSLLSRGTTCLGESLPLAS
jgi:hypothetical protein